VADHLMHNREGVSRFGRASSRPVEAAGQVIVEGRCG
jgi:hypothetical protein